jgi:glutamate-1-semialdehyde 2,1-aminomutase
MILGHAFEPVVQAVIKSKTRDFIRNANRLETQIAALAVAMVPNIDKIRFVQVLRRMSAVRLARG